MAQETHCFGMKSLIQKNKSIAQGEVDDPRGLTFSPVEFHYNQGV